MRRPIRPLEPLGELFRRGVRRRPVEGHQRRRDSWGSHDVGAPSIAADTGDFDLKCSTANRLAETMHARNPL
jgi:hypothetical protein